MDLLVHLEVVFLFGVVVTVIVVVGILKELIVIIVIPVPTNLIVLGQLTSLAYRIISDKIKTIKIDTLTPDHGSHSTATADLHQTIVLSLI